MAPPSHFELLNGTPPALGQVCTGFCLLHFYEDGQIADPGNVTYIKLGDVWHRLYFDGSTVFWRHNNEPTPAENTNLESGLLLNDLSGNTMIVGKELRAIRYETHGNITATTLEFSGGASVTLSHHADLDRTVARIGS